MPKLWLKFVVDLADFELPSVHQHFGPVFHRWLPDGEKDAIQCKTRHPSAKLKLWFERRGFVDDRGYIRFDYQRKELEQQVIPRQGALEGGPLIGKLELEDISDAELQSVLQDSFDENYLGLAKRVLDLWIYPSVSKLLSILRTNYGQYWVPELRRWDSRSESLGSYLSGLSARWSIDHGQTWRDFLLEPNVVTLQGSFDPRTFGLYLTETDWVEINTVMSSDYEPSTAAKVLSRAHRAFDEADFRLALVNGTTALEIALEEFVRAWAGNDEVLRGILSRLDGLGLGARLTIVAAATRKVSREDVLLSLDAIEFRHKIVHRAESDIPEKRAASVITGLFRAVSAFLQGPRFKFPRAYAGNMLADPGWWAGTGKQ